ncbi:hypothetical protein C2G38_2251049 [Gigaspora rosea]|uniref:Uncharacterized protein n=1 Tax=Gigaspora rosea TaxID=44941 RepID=A0A397URA2_9GLOM|nr:hypothetical protein C2G38_2251049 [Gigaspora rosea]
MFLALVVNMIILSGSELYQSSSGSCDIEDDINDESKDIENEDNDNGNSSISTSSNEILTYIGHILGSNIPIEVSQSNISISASTSLIADVNDLNAAAIYQQEIKEFLESTTKYDFGKAQNLVNVISKETGHHRSVASDTSIIPLAKEKKTEAETIIQKLNYMDTYIAWASI